MANVASLALRVALIWWLLLCARQDLHTRHIANWLTVPPFLAALPLSLYLAGLDRMLFCLLVIACGYVIWREGNLGAADAKMAGFLAAVDPGILLLALIALWIMYGVQRLQGQTKDRLSLPGAVGLFAGGVGMELWIGLQPIWAHVPL